MINKKNLKTWSICFVIGIAWWILIIVLPGDIIDNLMGIIVGIMILYIIYKFIKDVFFTKEKQ